MKAGLLIYFLICIFSLFSQNQLHTHYGISYPLGVFSGLDFENNKIDTSFELVYKENNLTFNTFHFRSDHISLGSLSFNGLLRDMNKENFHFYSFDNTSEVSINPEGNPEKNLGVIFNIDAIDSGMSVFRKDKYSQILFWKNFNLKTNCFINYTQSFSLLEFKDEIDTWYVSDYEMQSFFLWNHSFSIILGSKNFFTGGQIQFDSSFKDQPGFSVLLLTGVELTNLYLQNELRINSTYFKTSDLENNEYPFVLKGMVNYSGSIISLNNTYKIYWEREKFPWQNRLWTFEIETEGVYENPQWTITSSLGFDISNSYTELLDTSITFKGSIKRNYPLLFWQVDGSFIYDSIYNYFISGEIGTKLSLMDLKVNCALIIDNRIRMNFTIAGQFFFERFKIISNLNLEDIGIYNSEQLKLKPSFFIGIDINHLQK